MRRVRGGEGPGAMAVAVLAMAGPGLACSSARYGASDGQQPGVTLPVRFGEREGDAGSGRTVGPPPHPPRSPSGSAAASASPVPSAARSGDPPDPEPLQSAAQWEYVLLYSRGRVSVERVGRRTFDRPVVTPRRLGRFAIELWIGPELIDRIRFDFPLLAAEPVRTTAARPLAEPPTFAAGAEVRQMVLVPASERATRAVLLDRARGDAIALPWPPLAEP